MDLPSFFKDFFYNIKDVMREKWLYIVGASAIAVAAIYFYGSHIGRVSERIKYDENNEKATKTVDAVIYKYINTSFDDGRHKIDQLQEYKEKMLRKHDHSSSGSN